MSAKHSTFTSRADGTILATYEWDDLFRPRGAVQIAHGLAEHAGRYDRLAKSLNEAGYLVGAHDHRGHGKSISGRRGDFGDVGFPGLIEDMAAYGAALREDRPDLPLFLVAHSMGSFAAQSVLLEHSDQYAGAVLTGSTSLDVLGDRLASGEGPVGLEAFNAGFQHRTGYEWLSRDQAEVDAYVADPLCGFDLPAEAVPGLFTAAESLADPEVLSAIRSDLPILIASGSADPLAGGGELVHLLGQRYRDAGLADVTVKVYPEARHEIFNETNRDAVTADVVAWLNSHR